MWQCVVFESWAFALELVGSCFRSLSQHRFALEIRTSSCTRRERLSCFNTEVEGVSGLLQLMGLVLFVLGRELARRRHMRKGMVICTHLHACVHACMHACLHACRHARTHARMHACMHAYVHTYSIHTWAHIMHVRYVYTCRCLNATWEMSTTMESNTNINSNMHLHMKPIAHTYMHV